MTQYAPTKLTEAFIAKVQYQDKLAVIRDTKVTGLMLVVNKRCKSYKVQRDLWTGHRGRRRLVKTVRYTLGTTEELSLTVAGFEGGLITTDDKSSGYILINDRSSGQRQRFTIGHELGHYLNPWHLVGAGESFMCSKADMVASQYQPSDRRPKMEVDGHRITLLTLGDEEEEDTSWEKPKW